jgi:exopolysaccharide biosynthesis polyprenyl glycosylphosphotransferase
MAGRLAFLDAVFFFVVTAALALFQTAARGIGLNPSTMEALGQAAIASAACVAVLYVTKMHEPPMVRTVGALAHRLVASSVLIVVVLGGVFVAMPAPKASHPRLAIGVAVVLALFGVMRTLVYVLQSMYRERVLIVGVGPLAQELVESMRRFNVVVRLVSDDAAVPTRLVRQLIAGSVTDFRTIVGEFKPHRIIVALAERRGWLGVADLVDQRVRGVVVENATDAYERLAGQLVIDSMLPSDLVFGSGFTARPLYIAAARAGSAVAAVVTLIVLSPLLGLIAMLIKLDSPGPVFFVHERVGRHGKPFKLFKFRTMQGEPNPSAWVRDNARRITRVGRWLRVFRLDEVPQLVNVLCGHMNIVGPRPHPVSNYELFDASIPYYTVRSVVKPGITGWAQVRYGYANSLEEEAEKMRYDLYYIKHQSPALDLRILLDTVKVVLRRRGASVTMRREGALDDDRTDARLARYNHHGVS